jgi:class 3 adenylate cyclase/tetratricopeptide (TPR) repeat protein
MQKLVIRETLEQDSVPIVVLQKLWQARAEWIADRDTVCMFFRRAFDQGELLLAYDAARLAVEEHLPTDRWLRQHMALALAQMGATARAQELLLVLLSEDGQDRETLSFLGRTYKDQWCSGPANHQALMTAFEYYKRAFELEPHDPYPGINAASTALLRNDRDTASRLASRVIEVCGAQSEQDRHSYWNKATIAEALAASGRREEAQHAYRVAVSECKPKLRDLASTRKQARLLSRHLYGHTDTYDDCFALRKVVVFSGHMIDAAGRARPRFPAHQEQAVATAIRRDLTAIDAGIGFASAACGSDILFHEAMLERGATVHVVLPWSREEFVKTSVEFAEGNWRERFDAILARAASVRILGDLYMPGTALGLEYCNLAMSGLARIYARSLDLELIPIAVWDGFSGAPGGTGSFVRYWRSRNNHVRIVSFAGKNRGEPEPATEPEADDGQEEDEFEAWVRASGRQEIKAIMFADVVGYSKLTETAIPKFIAQFNQRISKLVTESTFAPIYINTWGDGLYFVFNGVEEAGRFALDLRDLVIQTDWQALGLPVQLNIRIALHAGPVYVSFDPLIRHLTFTGAHVSRAARIEPITKQGQVFTSEEFAALSAAADARGFISQYVGTTALAKNYGYSPIYSLERNPTR